MCRGRFAPRVSPAGVARRDPMVLHIYALKCALHYHAYKLAEQMLAARDVDAPTPQRPIERQVSVAVG